MQKGLPQVQCSPELCYFARWRGRPHINKVKQQETVLFFKVSLFIQFISLLVKMSFPLATLHTFKIC